MKELMIHLPPTTAKVLALPDEIRGIFFDVDDTLYSRKTPFIEACEDFWDKSAQEITAQYHFSMDEANARFRKRGDEVFLPSRRGEITMEEMYIYRFGKAMQDLGIHVTADESLAFQKLYETRQEKIHLTPEHMRTLDVCKAEGYILGAITNGPSDHQRDKFRALGLERWMSEELFFVSGDHGSNKPETLMFELAQERTGFKPQELLFIGDSYESDICGAAAAGWKTVWMNLHKEAVPGTVVPDWII